MDPMDKVGCVSNVGLWVWLNFTFLCHMPTQLVGRFCELIAHLREGICGNFAVVCDMDCIQRTKSGVFQMGVSGFG